MEFCEWRRFEFGVLADEVDLEWKNEKKEWHIREEMIKQNKVHILGRRVWISVIGERRERWVRDMKISWKINECWEN